MFVARAGGGRIEGYMLVWYGRSRTPERRPLGIREIVAADPAAYGRLIGFVSRQRDLWRRVRYDALPDERFDHLLTDPRPPGHATARRLWAETARVIRGPMFRVVDVARAFTMRRKWGAAPPFEFMMDVADPQLPGNAGPWRVRFDGRTASIRPASDGGRNSASTPVRLRVDAPTLAELYAGELSVEAAVRLGSAHVTGDASAIDGFFRPTSSFRLLDEF